MWRWATRIPASSSRRARPGNNREKVSVALAFHAGKREKNLEEQGRQFFKFFWGYDRRNVNGRKSSPLFNIPVSFFYLSPPLDYRYSYSFFFIMLSTAPLCNLVLGDHGLSLEENMWCEVGMKERASKKKVYLYAVLATQYYNNMADPFPFSNEFMNLPWFFCSSCATTNHHYQNAFSWHMYGQRSCSAFQYLCQEMAGFRKREERRIFFCW